MNIHKFKEYFVRKRNLSIATILAISGVVALTGCGGGGSSTVAAATSDNVGYFVDSPVVGADYDCLADGEMNKTTGPKGSFSCKNMSQIRFRIGKLELGTINSLPSDGYVFPQDLAGVPRDKLDDEKVLALAKLLQALDSDNDLTNGIQIPEEVKDIIVDTDEETHHKFKTEELKEYFTNTGISEDAVPDDNQTLRHLENSLNSVKNKDKAPQDHGNVQGNGKGNGQGNGQGNGNKRGQGAGEGSAEAHGNGASAETHGQGSIDLGTTTYTLSQELKDAIAYMGNEERLAHDVYLNLYDKYKDSSDASALYPLYNIATKSETKHVETVQAIVKKYSLGATALTNVSTPLVENGAATPVDQLPRGKYDIQKIQDLYDALYEKGSKSAKDALEVGCMVEVTDVNDLDEYISLAQGDGAQDVQSAFEKLRNASYNHYWAFDRALKNMGVEDGCCSLGEDFCKEYPKNGNGQGRGRKN